MSVNLAAAAARISSARCPLETARSVTESAFRPAAAAAAATRARSAAMRSGKFCEDLNIWTPKPLRYTALSARALFPGALAPVALGNPMAVDIAQLLAFAVKNKASDLHLSS